jgi:predicted small integral membrane protein
MLAAGDFRIGETRFIRTPVDIVGRDRILFGFALLGSGYVFLRWLFRVRGVSRRWGFELQVVAAFAVAGYVAYKFGLVS